MTHAHIYSTLFSMRTCVLMMIQHHACRLFLTEGMTCEVRSTESSTPDLMFKLLMSETKTIVHPPNVTLSSRRSWRKTLMKPPLRIELPSTSRSSSPNLHRKRKRNQVLRKIRVIRLRTSTFTTFMKNQKTKLVSSASMTLSRTKSSSSKFSLSAMMSLRR